MKKLTQDEFIEKCRNIHGIKFDYSKTNYINTRTKITVICPTHGEFNIIPSNHLIQKQGCWSCFLDKHRLTEISKERLENLKRIHNYKYEYKDISVKKGFINIECPIHGNFKQYLYFHEYGHGCSECNSSSKGEDRIVSIFKERKIKFLRNYQFEYCKRIKKLKFDFYMPDYNICIEYDGEHHFKENKYFGEGNLEYIKINDSIKNEFCKLNDIKLIRISYKEFKNIENILKEKIK
jgi:very-short-patch-repair endonuclease